MTDRHQFTRVHLDTFEGAPDMTPPVPRDETPFCVAILADLSGRAGREGEVARPALAARRPLLVDRDDLEAVLARVAPVLRLALDDGAPPVELRVASLDDFHPDRLYERLPLFAALRETRRRLADPATFAAAAHELGAGASGGPAPAAAAPPAPPAPPATPTLPATAAPPASPASGGGLLDQILGEGPAQGPPPEEGGDLAAFIRQAVRPYLVPRPDPRQAELLAAVDAAIAAQLRRILHHPAVQALEATWRGLDLLVRRVETGTQLRLAVFDVTAGELAGDAVAALTGAAGAGGRPPGGGVAAMLADGGQALLEPGPWSLVALLHDLGDGAADLALLRHLGAIGAGHGAPLLAGAHPRLAMLATDAGDEAGERAGVAAAWQALRRSPLAPWIALLLPRILLRLPYGEDGEACDVVRFDELPAPAGGAGGDAATVAERHGMLLWGSAALAGVIAFAGAFADGGWRMRPRHHLDVERLPLYLHRLPGGTVAQPCTEVAFGVDDAGQLLDAGLLPLVTMRDSDTVRLAGLGSIAAPGRELAGRWVGA